jgi:class I fructose-bisphosphate aldolase
VPVVIAGGEKMESDKQIFEMIRGAMDAGGAGVSIGRNVFQHQDPTRMVGAISMIVHENATAHEASAFLNGNYIEPESRRVTA